MFSRALQTRIPLTGQTNEMANGDRNLRINQVTVDDDYLATGEKWEEWLEELERELRFFRIRTPEDNRDAVLIFGGKEIRRLNKCLQDPNGDDIYTRLKSKLTSYFEPMKNVHYARHVFISFAARLREKAINCAFHDCDERILEQIMQTTENAELLSNILRKNWTLQQTLEEMQLTEGTSIQVKPMGLSETKDTANIKRIRKRKYMWNGKET